MKSPAWIPVNGERKNPLHGLLSVDADAHLEKLTANVFPSPALLPVELVRSALKRKASAVAIHIRSDRIEISDDGAVIAPAEWQALACLADTRQSAAAREKALADIQDQAHPGIGLLAVFMPGARRILIESAGTQGKICLRIENGRCEALSTCSRPRGTHIAISRRRVPSAGEQALLNELCASADAAITVNGRPVRKKTPLADSLAATKIRLSGLEGPSQLAIPVQGDVCRIWLLDQGIPWQVTASAPVRGSIFSAALETRKQLTQPMLEDVATAAHRLYHWLAENYEHFPEPYQFRIEDLFFKQARAGGDPLLLANCALFRIWRSQRRLTLDDVRRRAEGNGLYAVDRGDSVGFLGGLERDVLVLTRQQKDFLINHLGLPIIVLNAQQKLKFRPQRIRVLFRAANRGWQKIAGWAGARGIDSVLLSDEEQRLCRELEMHWQQQPSGRSSGRPPVPLSVRMVESRGLAPSRLRTSKKNNLLLIRRRHPLTRQAVRCVGRDPDNVELAFAALMPSHF